MNTKNSISVCGQGRSPGYFSTVAFLILISLLTAHAGGQLASIPDPAINPGAGGGGDSGAPILSVDGRYVLFSSTAENLVLTTSSNAFPVLLAPRLNVFLRDRVSNTTALVSVNAAGAGGGDNDSAPAGISTNGQYVLFASRADNLVTNVVTGAGDIFIRDVVNNITSLVSVNTNGGGGNGESRTPVMTSDGRFVAFVSAATNLVAGYTNQVVEDIFVRDLQAGATTLASVGAKGGGGSESPEITPDGRFVAFFSTATNLVRGVTNAGEVYVRNLSVGTTYWASTNAQGIVQSVAGFTNYIAYDPQISTNGQFVAFTAKPANPVNPANPVTIQGVVLRYNLLTGLTDVVFTNASGALYGIERDAQVLDMTPDGRFIAFEANAGTSTTCIYQWDALTATNVLVSGNVSNTVTAGVAASLPIQTPDGRYVAFFSNDTNLAAGAQPVGSLFLRDTLLGTTEAVDLDANGSGPGADASAIAAISDDGQSIAFERIDGNLSPNDSTHDWDVFVTDLATETTGLISAHHPALPSLTPNGSSELYGSSVSANGRYLAFASDAANLAANVTNGNRNVFVRDFLWGINLLVSVNTNGSSGAGSSTEPAISGDGRWVAFSSYATDLVAGDTTNNRNVFLRDLQNGTTALVSVSTNGGYGNADSYSPTISSDGRYILFYSQAPNLAPGSYPPVNQVENIFVRDQISGITYALTTIGDYSPGQSASMTPDGHFIAFVRGGSGGNLFVWNTELAQLTSTNNSTSLATISISPDGQRLAYLAGSPLSLSVVDFGLNSNWVVSAGTFLSHPGLGFSGDSRYLAYATSAANVPADTNLTQDVYLYDFQTGTNILISWNSTSSGSPNGPSDSPAVSADGRFVAYRSFASDIVTNDLNGVPDVFLYDRTNGTTTLLSVDQTGNGAANNRSLNPVFSGDGLTLVFQSAASDLTANDFNNSGDLFSFDLIALPGTGLGGSTATNTAPVFYTQLSLPGVSSSYPVLSWPLVSGQSYHAQFKDNLTDPSWQDVNGSIIFIGGTGYINDHSPSASQRFYRIVLGE